ncbi:MAG: hypothetical protein ACRD3J_31105, partial [Thermoanaerobaculia bacterium]
VPGPEGRRQLIDEGRVHGEWERQLSDSRSTKKDATLPLYGGRARDVSAAQFALGRKPVLLPADVAFVLRGRLVQLEPAVNREGRAARAHELHFQRSHGPESE